MVSITLSIPEEVREIMKQFPEINWSGLVRKSIIERANELKMKEEMLNELKKEQGFNDWAVELGRKAKKGRLARIGQ